MSEEPKSIAKQPVLKPAEDFYRLRQEGIGFIEKMGSELWTDYNAHDPGITILEACCYAITDIAYRIGWDIKDILTRESEKNAASSSEQKKDGQKKTYPDQAFFTANDILPVNPVTPDDFRRLLIDLPEVRNAWITEAKEEKFIGIYNVLVELEDKVDKDKQDEIKKRVEASVERELHSCRNLCEDYNKIKFVDTENIAVCAEIELRPDTDIDLAQERIFLEIEKYFNPPIPFRTLDEQLNNKEKVEEIFNGPKVTSGFLTTSDLESASLRRELRVSDIINILMDIDGVISIRHIALLKYDENNSIISDKWKLTVKKHCRPKLKIFLNKEEEKKKEKLNSCFIFYQNGMPFKLETTDKDENKISQLRSESERSKHEISEESQDIHIPLGVFRDLNEYFPIQYSLPTTYGIGPEGLSDQVSNERQAQAKQLKAYMMFFEQMLANSFSQLEHTDDLFSLDSNDQPTYFDKKFDETIIAGLNEIFEPMSGQNETKKNGNNQFVESAARAAVDQSCGQGDISATYSCSTSSVQEQNSKLTQNTTKSSSNISQEDIIRRNRFLDHLLARFGERFDDYDILRQREKKDLIEDKISLIKAYPNISSNRAKAFNYTKNSGQYLGCIKKNENLYIVQDSNAPELKRRVSLLLGCPHFTFFWETKKLVLLKNEIYPQDDGYDEKNCESMSYIEKSEEVIRLISNQKRFCIKENNSSSFLSFKRGDGRRRTLLAEKHEKAIDSILVEEEKKDNFYLLLLCEKNIDLKYIARFATPCKTEEEAEIFQEELIRWSIFQRAIIVEHILLRPQPQSSDDKNAPFPDGEDIYSFRLTYVIPGWHGLNNSNVTDRESFINLREFAEHIIRQEMPSHLLVNIIWADKESFENFEKVWLVWLRAQGAAECNDVSKYRSGVIEQLCNLKNIYPPAIFNNNIRLGKTALGGSDETSSCLGCSPLKKMVLDNSTETSVRFKEIVLDNSTLQ